MPLMFTSNFGRAGSRKDTKDEAMAQGVCCQAGNNGFCQDTTPCADALRERRCTHVIIIVAIWVLGLVPMSLNWRAICGWRNDDQCYAAALGVGLACFSGAGACLACLCLNDRVRQNTPAELSANLARYKAQVAIRARLRAALRKGDQEAAAPVVEELLENLDVRPAEP